MTLEDIRRQIDGIDSRIIEALAERGRLVTAAGKLKLNEHGVRDRGRLEQVIEKARASAEQAGLSPDIAEEVYRTITGCFLRKELTEFSVRESNAPAGPRDFTLRKANDRDDEQIVSIFNHYVEHSFAAYPDRSFDVRLFDFMKTIVYGDAFFVLESGASIVVGFGFLKKYHTYPVFNRTAEVGYFILPEYTRIGLGTRFLATLEEEARKLGVDNLLANISSLNTPSLEFHRKQGFRECGRFRKIVKKLGQDMDIVWMQKML